MLKKLKSLLWTTFLGGVTVILPVAITYLVFTWLFSKVLGMTDPLATFLSPYIGFRFLADMIAITVLLSLCFAVGAMEKTKLGHIVLEGIEELILAKIPGYGIVKETVMQFMGGKESPFSQVVLVRLFDSEVLVTGFLTDRHKNGWFTVFVPTGPNPTSGFIYHMPPERVNLIDHPVDETMRSVISCGVGSRDLIEKLPR